MSRESLTESQIRQAFALYKSGVKIDDIADRYYVSTRTLERMFARRRLRKGTGNKRKPRKINGNT